MKRIMIIGCCGAGKSTFARKLHSLTGIKVIYLDQQYFSPNWEEPQKDEWTKKVKNLVKADQWIIDGNYGGTMNIRLERSDTIFYLKYTTLSCLYRVIKRVITYHGTVRPNMAKGCKERFDLEFIHYVAVFNFVKGKSIEKRLKGISNDKKIIVLKNDKEVSNYIKHLEGSKSQR
ncbi:MAG: DNA topology modulation protein [Saprospiraceae bacterium]